MCRHVCTERTSKHKCQQEVQIGCRAFWIGHACISCGFQFRVQGLKPRLERGLQESLRRLRFPRQLNSGKWGGVGGGGKSQDSWPVPGPNFQPPRARWNYPSQQHTPPTTNVFVGLGSSSRGQSLLAIRLIGSQGEVLWLKQPQLPFMYTSCFDFPWPPVVNGFAADFESLLLYLSFFARPVMLWRRVEVSIVSIFGPCRRGRRRQGPPSQLMKWRLASLRWGLGISGCWCTSRWSSVGRNMPTIFKPDDGAHTWLLPISETPLCRKAGLRSPSLAQPFVLLYQVDIRQVGARRLGQCCVSFGTEPPWAGRPWQHTAAYGCLAWPLGDCPDSAGCRRRCCTAK